MLESSGSLSCGWCSTPFERASPQGRAPLFCSKICKAKTDYSRRRARRDGKPVEKIMPRDIFERDGWLCHICAEPIDRSKKGKHPRAPALDHLIPIAHPDYPGHIAANVAASHWGCNSAKNARMDDADRELHRKLMAGIPPGPPLRRRPWTNAESTHCMNGHEYTEETTYLRPDRGATRGRSCKVCAMDRQRVRNKRQNPADRKARVDALRAKHGRRSGWRPVTRTRVVRAWATMRGMDVNAKGVIRHDVVDAFDETIGRLAMGNRR